MEHFLTPEQFRTLGSQIGGQPGICSPFYQSSKEASAVPVPPETQQALQSAGILSTLSFPSAAVVYSYTGLDLAFKTAQYSPLQQGTGPSVSVSETDEGLKISSPPQTRILLEMVLQYMGHSQLCMVDMDITLPLREAAVMFAFLDAGRKALLQGLLDGRGLDQPPAVVLPDVLSAGQSTDANLQWITPYYLEISDQAPLQKTDLDQIIPILEGKAFLSSKSGKMIPSPDFQRLMVSFLLLDSYTRIQAAKGSREEDLQNLDIWAIQGRNHALLSWSMDENSITLKGLSPAQWLLLLNGMLDNPEKMFLDVESSERQANTAIPAVDGSRICPSCSSSVPIGKKFCTGCGQKMD